MRRRKSRLDGAADLSPHPLEILTSIGGLPCHRQRAAHRPAATSRPQEAGHQHRVAVRRQINESALPSPAPLRRHLLDELAVGREDVPVNMMPAGWSWPEQLFETHRLPSLPSSIPEMSGSLRDIATFAPGNCAGCAWTVVWRALVLLVRAGAMLEGPLDHALQLAVLAVDVIA
ncbi:MAG: hypothetical protein IPO18_08390 [bacterium]|nr:hypothetical protein [bacterium]